MDNPSCLAVIDDDVSIRRSLDGLIRSLGFEVECFVSAESFLKQADTTRFACILTDMNMPGGMTGLDLIGRLRGDGNVTPMMLISAYMDDALSAKAVAAGFVCVLKKPFIGQQIIKCLDNAMATSG